MSGGGGGGGRRAEEGRRRGRRRERAEGSAVSPGQASWLLVGLAVIGVLGLLVHASLDFLPPLYTALVYNWLTRSYHQSPYSAPGMYLLLPWAGFRLVPSTVLTIPFGSTSDSQPVWARARQGVQVVLTVSVQYKYEPTTLRSLLLDVQTSTPDPLAEGDRSRTFFPAANLLRPLALSALCDAAAEFPAHEFFWRRHAVNVALADAAKRALSRYVNVTSVQLLRIDIPQQFEAAMMDSAVSRLQIEQAERIKQRRKVQFRTLRMAATYAMVATVNRARGRAAEVLQRGLANAIQTRQTVSAEIDAFANVSDRIGDGAGVHGGGGLPSAVVQSAVALHGPGERVTPHQVLDYAFWQLVMGKGAAGQHTRLPLHDLLLLPPKQAAGHANPGRQLLEPGAASAASSGQPSRLRQRMERRRASRASRRFDAAVHQASP